MDPRRETERSDFDMKESIQSIDWIFVDARWAPGGQDINKKEIKTRMAQPLWAGNWHRRA